MNSTLPFRRPSTAGASGDAMPYSENGELHLFYLASPSGPLDYPDRVRGSAFHAKSTDLKTWTELPPALTPGAPGTYDGGGIWTGSVVKHGGVYYYFYTGHNVGAENPQSICVATSTDLVHFEKYAKNPLLLPPSRFEQVDWRDPFVFWNDEESCWWMLIAARLTEGPYWRRGCIVLATSNNLFDWTVEEEPLYMPDTTFCPECPEMWQDASGRWHLVYSRFSEEVGTVSRVADSPRGPFREPTRPDLGGRRWYAAKSAPWQGERAFFGWIHDRVTDGETRWLWGGDFALPRIASATKEGSLDVRPIITDIAQVSSVSQRLEAIGSSQYLEVASAVASNWQLKASFTPEPETNEVGLWLYTHNEDGWRVEVKLKTGEVRLRREKGPLDDFWADLTHRQTEYREVDGQVLASNRVLGRMDQVNLTCIVQGDLIEIFVNEQVALSHRLDGPDQVTKILAYVQDGAADLSASIGEF